MKDFLFVLLTLPLLIFCEEPMEVRLATEVPLVPVYMSRVKGDGKELNIPYYQELDKILRFDLNHNGSTFTLAVTKERENFHFKSWKRDDVYFVIEATIDGKTLETKIYDLEGMTEYRIGGIKLEGTLSKDRTLIHELADKLHEELFGVKGIAATKIIFTDKKGEWGEIWGVDYDGGNLTQLTSQGSLSVTPSFIAPSPGMRSKDFLYVCYKTGQPKIFKTAIGRGNGQRVTTLRGNQLMPELSRERDQLVFISDAAGNPDVFLSRFDPLRGPMGKPRQIYAVPFATQGSPVFSPDGKEIAFVSNKDGRPRIYTMPIPAEGQKLNEIKPKLLIKQNRSCTAPSWSPDGTKIAYTSKAEGVRQIWVIDLTNGIDKQVTFGPGNKENPTWAPNSLHLAYNDPNNLYMLNLHQLKPVKITTGSSEKKFPSWEKR